MFLNIITPCSRPDNLNEVSKSINIPPEHYRWIVLVRMPSTQPQLQINPMAPMSLTSYTNTQSQCKCSIITSGKYFKYSKSNPSCFTKLSKNKCTHPGNVIPRNSFTKSRVMPKAVGKLAPCNKSSP